MGSSTENSRLRALAQPVGPDARARAARAAARPPRSSAGLAPWALGSDTGGSIKQPAALCGIVGLRPTYGTVCRYGIVAFASSLDQVGPVAKTVRDCALLYRSSPAATRRLDHRRAAAAGRGARRRGPEGSAHRRPRRDARGRGHRAGRAATRSPRGRALRGARRRRRRVLAAAVGRVRPAVLLPDRPGRGLLEPGPLRRRPLRPPLGPGDGLIEVYERTRSDGFRRRAEAADHARHLRALGRLLRRVLRQGAAGADGDHPRARRRLRALRPDRLRDLADGRVPASASAHGDPLAMYASDLLTIPSCMAGLPGLSIPCGLSEGLPVGLQLIGPQFSENMLFRAGHALERALGFDFVPERLR